MAKLKCAICNDNRAKRKCLLHDDQLICPSCCAELRAEACEGCRHYQAAARYEASKTDAKANKEFIIEINEEVEEAVDRALMLVEKGRFENAGKMLHDLEKKHPGNHMVMYGLGTACAFQDDFEGAIKYFEKAVAIFPYFVEAYYNLGGAYRKKFELRKAVDCMRKVIEIGGDNELVDNARNSIRFLEETVVATSHISLNEFFKAKELFDSAFSHMEKGRWEPAIAGFQKSLEINKDHAQSHGNMGLCYAQLGEKSKALASFDKALEIDPDYEPAIANKIQVQRMREGEPLTLQEMKTIEYYPEYRFKNRSYLQSLLRKVGQWKPGKKMPQ